MKPETETAAVLQETEELIKVFFVSIRTARKNALVVKEDFAEYDFRSDLEVVPGRDPAIGGRSWKLEVDEPI